MIGTNLKKIIDPMNNENISTINSHIHTFSLTINENNNAHPGTRNATVNSNIEHK